MSNCNHRFIPKRGEKGALCGKRCKGRFCAKHQRQRVAKRNRAKIAAFDKLIEACCDFIDIAPLPSVELKLLVDAITAAHEATK